MGLASPDGAEREFRAQLVGTDPGRDLAVLLVDDPDALPLLKPATLGTSGDLRVGQSVYAIGNPGGLQRSMSAGILSGTGRTIPRRATSGGL